MLVLPHPSTIHLPSASNDGHLSPTLKDMASSHTIIEGFALTSPLALAAWNAEEMSSKIPASPTLSDKSSVRSVFSSSSSSGRSYTSTIKYDQEPYDLFSQRVEKLCQQLWPPETSIKHRILKSNAAARLRTNRFIGSLVPSLPNILIERLPGGDYNRITGVTLPSTNNVDNHRLILRVPREEKSRPDREVALLNYVRKKTSIPVAQIAAKDFSRDNPLEKPYVLQQRIPGTDLSQVWDDLNHNQRLSVARKLGGVIRQLLSLESPVAGILEARKDDAEVADQPLIVPFELREQDGDGDLLEDREARDPVDIGSLRAPHSTLKLFESLLTRWRAWSVAGQCDDNDPEVRLWDTMLKAVHEMEEMQLFKSDLNCLCHIDLHPRNIMVEIQSDNCLEVTGILDWDEAVFAPKFVNCEPPGWLWGYNVDDHVDEDDSLPWPYEVEGANDLPSTPEQQELKCIFEESAGPGYLGLAYDEHSRLCRGLFRIATLGLEASHHWKAAERILKEWDVLRQSLRQQRDTNS